MSFSYISFICLDITTIILFTFLMKCEKEASIFVLVMAIGGSVIAVLLPFAVYMGAFMNIAGLLYLFKQVYEKAWSVKVYIVLCVLTNMLILSFIINDVSYIFYETKNTVEKIMLTIFIISAVISYVLLYVVTYKLSRKYGYGMLFSITAPILFPLCYLVITIDKKRKQKPKKLPDDEEGWDIHL